MVEEIQQLRTRLEAHAASQQPKGNKEDRLPASEEQQKRSVLEQKARELTRLQGETPLVQPVVDRQAVAAVVSGWTGIPVGKMVLDEIKTVLTLKEKLEERIIGQAYALEAIAHAALGRLQ